jgi:hypothetical protein
VVIKGLGFVLGQHDDLVNSGVDAVAQCKVDQPINAAEGNRRFGAVSGEGHEPLTSPASHDKGQSIFHLSVLFLLDLVLSGKIQTYQ